jgi:lysophospholipase L1-like esterase
MHALPPDPPAIVAPAPAPAAVTPLPAPTSAAPASQDDETVPVPRPGATAPQWIARHDGFVARAKAGKIDTLFLGDSITDWFPSRGSQAWGQQIEPLGTVANFGISGDRVPWLLWRIEHGELDGSGARVVVLMIGTNDLQYATPSRIAQGITDVLTAVRARLPDAVVILNALLPRSTPNDPLRAQLAQVNQLIRPLADGTRVRWLDAGAPFLAGDGTIPLALMPDRLHPSAQGYQLWAHALQPLLSQALAQK